MLREQSYIIRKGYDCFCRNVKAKLDLSIFATDVDLKEVGGVDTQKITEETDLTNLKAQAD